jgi:hypothetical protein
MHVYSGVVFKPQQGMYTYNVEHGSQLRARLRVRLLLAPAVWLRFPTTLSVTVLESCLRSACVHQALQSAVERLRKAAMHDARPSVASSTQRRVANGDSKGSRRLVAGSPTRLRDAVTLAQQTNARALDGPEGLARSGCSRPSVRPCLLPWLARCERT